MFTFIMKDNQNPVQQVLNFVLATNENTNPVDKMLSVSCQL